MNTIRILIEIGLLVLALYLIRLSGKYFERASKGM